MNKGNQSGAVNALLLPLIAVFMLLIAAGAFGYWAFSERQDYKDHADVKISEAVAVAQKAESTVKEKEFAEREKNPLKTYTGPSEFGSMTIQYPKTWSGYVPQDSQSSPFVDGYFAPGVVPKADVDTSVFALRAQVVGETYSSLLENYNDAISQGTVTVQPYSAPKVPNVVGSRVEGAIAPNKTGSMILLPLRDKTLVVWTESDAFKADFNNIILPNLTFSP